MSKNLERLACKLYDLDSLRTLFEELNFEFSDDPVSKSSWTDEEKNAINESKIVATKFGYGIYYLRTNEKDFKLLKAISTKIIKANNGLCLICSHNPNGFKWIFSMSSNDFSTPFNKTHDLPLVTTKDTQISKQSIEFLENIRAPKESNAIALQEQIAKAFDTFMIQIRHNEDSKYDAGERSRAFSEISPAKVPEPRLVDLRLAMGNRLDALGIRARAAGLAEIERAVELEPRSADLRLAMGAKLHELGFHAKAAAAFDKAVSLAPGEPAALAGLGVSLCNLGYHVDSLKAFSKAVEMEPGNAELYIGMGHVLLELGRHGEATLAFNRASGLELGCPGARGRGGA